MTDGPGDAVQGGAAPPQAAGAPHGEASDGVHLRMLVVGGMPLIVAGLGEGGHAPRLRDRLADAGLVPLPHLLGADLPRGARVGFVLDTAELRLVDERDEPLVRAPRSGVDGTWLEAARRFRGTMTVVVSSGVVVDGVTPPERLVQAVDAAARTGDVLGAIVGVVEERPSLPLIF